MLSSRRSIMIVVVALLSGASAALWRYLVAMDLSRSYARASCVTPFRDAASLTDRVWDSMVTAGAVGPVHVQAACRVRGDARVTFQGDSASRPVTPIVDYVYPCDIRFDGQSLRLYIKTEGLGGGVLPETLLYEYDLQERRVTHSVHVRAAWLPGECAVGERHEGAG